MPQHHSKAFNMNHVVTLTTRHNVDFVTGVFQSDFDGGNCRGIVQGYIANYIDSIRTNDSSFIQTYRKKMSSYASERSFFSALHGDLAFNNFSIGSSNRPSMVKIAKALSLQRSNGVLIKIDAPNSIFFDSSSSYFTDNGLYCVFMPKHVVLYVKNLGSFTFLDANSGEWRTRHANEMESFLQDYFSMIYAGTRFDGLLSRIFWYPI